MRKYYCDICGKEMLKPDADAVRSCEAAMAIVAEDVCARCLDIGRRINVRAMVRKHWQALAGVSTVPPVGNSRPAAAGSSETAVITTSKQETGRSAQNVPGPGAVKPAVSRVERKTGDAATAASGSLVKTDANAPGRKPGQHWAEKRRIMGELRAYREANGLGSLYALAKAANLEADVLRQMLNAKPYPIDIWQRVDKGLQKLRKSETVTG